MSLWRRWNIHGFILSGLLVQVILFFAAPLRKKTNRVIVVGLIWCLYQLAEALPTHALSNLRSAASKGLNKADDVTYLHGFWAVCLLLQFGGPDNITALSMEDNFLWQRSMFRFVAQVITTLAVQNKSKLEEQQYLFLCSNFIMIAGLMKSLLKISSRFLASSYLYGGFHLGKADPGPDYAAIVEQHNFYKERGIPVEFVEKNNEEPSCVAAAAAATADGLPQDENDAQLFITQQACRFYTKFKGTFRDQVFCCHSRLEARDVFLHLSPQAAFLVAETEMKFAYEDFYTISCLYQFAGPLSGCRYQFNVVFLLELVALPLWFSSMHHFQSVDAFVTTCLLAGAVFIEIIAFLRIYLSDWTIAHAGAESTFSLSYIALPLRTFLLYMRRRRWGDSPQETSLFHKVLRFFFRQWSESIAQFNFIDCCIRKRPDCCNTLYACFGAKGMMDDWSYVTSRWLTNNLRKFIIEELQEKSSIAETLHRWDEVSSCRGGWILRCNASDDLDPATFEPYISEVEYDESLLMWHIATEILYQTEKMPGDENEQEHRAFSKILSDYMLYLSVRQPNLMSKLAPMAEVIFKASCEEAWRLLQKAMPVDHKGACERIVQVGAPIQPSFIKEQDDNSVLFDASLLAKRLKTVKRNRWKLVSQIWVELLCYAAVHTPGVEHAKLLSQGGELVILVRLLTLHLGLSNQFRVAKNIPRAELVVVES